MYAELSELGLFKPLYIYNSSAVILGYYGIYFTQSQSVTLSIIAWNFHDNLSGLIDSFEIGLGQPFETMKYPVIVNKRGYYRLGVMTFSYQMQKLEDSETLKGELQTSPKLIKLNFLNT